MGAQLILGAQQILMVLGAQGARGAQTMNCTIADGWMGKMDGILRAPDGANNFAYQYITYCHKRAVLSNIYGLGF